MGFIGAMRWGRIGGWMAALALGLAVAGCAPPPPPTPPPPPDAVVRSFLEAQRRGDAEMALRQWGFATGAFRSRSSPADEAGLREQIGRRAAAGEPREYRVGDTLPSAAGDDRRFVQVWLNQPPPAPPALYELALTPEGWRIVGFAPAPAPPQRQP